MGRIKSITCLLIFYFLLTHSIFADAKGGLSKSYQLINLRETSWDVKSVTALAWLGDQLVVAEFGGVTFGEKIGNATKDGAIWLLSGVLTAQDPGDVTREKIFGDLHQPMGLYVENGEIYIHLKGPQATQIWKATKTGNTWEMNLWASGWGEEEGFWWHSWPGGLIKRDGYFYFNFSSLPEKHAPNAGETVWPPIYKGSLIKLDANNPTQYEPVANGMRTNAAVFFGPFGSIMGPDVQGDWKPDNQLIQIQPGGFYGHSARDADALRPATNPPSVSMPQGSASRSPGDGHYLTSGPFTGQMLVGDQAYRGMNRYHLESINGQLQGTVIDFFGTNDFNGMSQAHQDMERCHPWAVEPTPDGSGVVFGCAGGWWVSGPTTGSIGMLVPTGEVGFEVLAIRNIDRTTMEIEFTKDINTSHAVDAGRFDVNTWTNAPVPGYGQGAKQDNHSINPLSAGLAPGSNNKVRLTFANSALSTGDVTVNGNLLEGLGYVLEFRLNVQSTTGESLYDNLVFYTLNQFGPGITPVPGCTNSAATNYKPNANDDDGSCNVSIIQPEFNLGTLTRHIKLEGSHFTLSVSDVNKYSIKITNLSGQVVQQQKRVQGNFKSANMKPGVYLIRINSSKGSYVDKVLLY